MVAEPHRQGVEEAELGRTEEAELDRTEEAEPGCMAPEGEVGASAPKDDEEDESREGS